MKVFFGEIKIMVSVWYPSPLDALDKSYYSFSHVCHALMCLHDCGNTPVCVKWSILEFFSCKCEGLLMCIRKECASNCR